MVEKKINFNQPILSVRRCSEKMAYEAKTKNVVPRFRPSTPDLNSGPVAVPFQWEQIPGKPKEEMKREAVIRCQNIGDDEMKEEGCDEIDSLSITESFVSSCSMSSLHEDDTNDSSRTFSMDVKQEKPGFWYRPTFAKSCWYYNEKEVCDDHDDGEHEKLLICCLLPRSCLKSSVGFVNPIPATSVMGRFAVFPSTGILSGCSSAENEDENKKAVNDHGRLSFVEGFGSRENSIKTLQELLADEDKRKELESKCGDHFDIMSLVDEKSDVPKDSRKKSEEKQLSRSTTLGNSHIPRFPIPPPLPRSPSDSWLFRAMATNKASRSSSSSSLSRCTNKS